MPDAVLRAAVLNRCSHHGSAGLLSCFSSFFSSRLAVAGEGFYRSREVIEMLRQTLFSSNVCVGLILLAVSAMSGALVYAGILFLLLLHR